jgi:hypothetical protein
LVLVGATLLRKAYRPRNGRSIADIVEAARTIYEHPKDRSTWLGSFENWEPVPEKFIVRR